MSISIKISIGWIKDKEQRSNSIEEAPFPSSLTDKDQICQSCLRWINSRCTEQTIDVFASFPRCFLKRESVAEPS